MGMGVVGGNVAKGGPLPTSGNFVVETNNIVPDPPKALGEEGQSRWKEISKILAGRGMWSDDWITALEHTCRSYDNLFEIDRALNQQGESFVVFSANARSTKLHPLLDYRLKIEAFINCQLNNFGLTPISSRGIFVSKHIGEDKQKARVRDRKRQPLFQEPAK